MKHAALTVVLILLSHLLYAQIKTDTIGTKRGWLGGKWYTYEGKKIRTTHKLTTIVRQDPEAFHIYKKARTTHVIQVSFACAGLACLTASDIYAFSKKPFGSYNQNPALFTALGCVVVAYPFAFLTAHNQKKAIRKYNQDVMKTSYNETKPQFYFSYIGTTIGIGLKF